MKLFEKNNFSSLMITSAVVTSFSFVLMGSASALPSILNDASREADSPPVQMLKNFTPIGSEFGSEFESDVQGDALGKVDYSFTKEPKDAKPPKELTRADRQDIQKLAQNFIDIENDGMDLAAKGQANHTLALVNDEQDETQSKAAALNIAELANEIISQKNGASLTSSSPILINDALLPEEDKEKKIAGFTKYETLEYAKYASAAYKFTEEMADKSEDIAAIKKEGSKIFSLKKLADDKNNTWTKTTFENQDTGIFVVKKDGTAVLAFKGSDRLNTWISDANMTMTEHKDGGIYHSGFLAMYNELEAAAWNQIGNFMSENGYSVKEAMEKITITGHSRGAGCAQVFADIAYRKTGATSRLITFAAPRALHKWTAHKYDELKTHLRIMQDGDAVVYAALASANGGSHTGETLVLPVVEDMWMHQMGGYTKALKALVENGEVKRNDGATTYKWESSRNETWRDRSKEMDINLISLGKLAFSPPISAGYLGIKLFKAATNPYESYETMKYTGIAGIDGLYDVSTAGWSFASYLTNEARVKIQRFVAPAP